jgi:hypothetical protein
MIIIRFGIIIVAIRRETSRLIVLCHETGLESALPIVEYGILELDLGLKRLPISNLT